MMLPFPLPYLHGSNKPCCTIGGCRHWSAKGSAGAGIGYTGGTGAGAGAGTGLGFTGGRGGTGTGDEYTGRGAGAGSGYTGGGSSAGGGAAALLAPGQAVTLLLGPAASANMLGLYGGTSRE